MERVKLKAPNKWEKGMEKKGGRKIGTPNKVTAQLKHAIIEAAAMVGFDGEGEGALHGFLMRLAMREPAVYGGLLRMLLPMQLQGRVEGEVKVKYQTVEEFHNALKERGLPIPPKMITLDPREVREVKSSRE